MSVTTRTETRFRYDERAGRYRGPNGRFVSPSTVHGWVAETNANSGRAVRELTQQLRTGAIDIRTWQLEMATNVKQAHIANAIAAKGGREMMTPADWGRVGRILRDEYGKYLRPFAEGLANGTIPMDGRIVARAEQYMLAATETYWRTLQREQERRGLTESRRLLGSAEHCEDCVGYAELGWRPIGELPPPGSGSRCMSRCKCRLEFR